MEIKNFDETRIIKIFRELDERAKNTVIDFIYLQKRICDQYAQSCTMAQFSILKDFSNGPAPDILQEGKNKGK